ncbi:MAG TPA: efflux RND transporter permease subunit [Candidatus Hydrogenedentes bacterium]|nr:efflux RND transporter permease subunit [Candidatus Hydrogenedentota bacterium]
MTLPETVGNIPKRYSIAIRRPVTMAMLFLTLIVFGWRSFEQLPVNLMPDISYPTLTVRTEYEGAAPEDVEKLVTRPLEEMLAVVGGVVEISSISSPGLSEIVLEFNWDTDMALAQQEVRTRLDLFEPPKEVTEKPVILRYDPTLDPIVRLAIAPGSADGAPLSPQQEQKTLTEIRDAVERHIKSDLESETGVAQVAVKGGREEEIQVLVDSERIKNLGLSLNHIVDALAQQNINLSGGRLQEGKTEYMVRTLNEFADINEIKSSIIVAPDGRAIRLDEAAQVSLGFKERENVVRINGMEAVELKIFKEGDANTVSVADRVKDLMGVPRPIGITERMLNWTLKTINSLLKTTSAPPGSEADKQRTLITSHFPKGSKVAVISDQSLFIKGSINEVQDACLQGGLLSLAVLYLFLRELKSTLIVGVALPISVIATFIPMFMQHISLNIMSLGGLAMGIGTLVDNAIVVLESVFRCKEEGDSAMDAAERGTREVFAPVISAALTTVCVFLPIAFVQGIAGQLFKDLAWTVTYSTLASMFAALYLIPTIVSRHRAALASRQQVIWVLRAYREGRDVHHKGRLAALAGIPSTSLRYAGGYLRDSAHDTFGWAILNMKGPGLMPRLGAALALPVLLALYPFQVLLHAVSALLIFMIFLVALIVLVLASIFRTILTALFWLPLTLFNNGFDVFRSAYGVFLRHSLRFSPILLLLVAGVAFHAMTLAPKLGRELIPPMNQGEFGIRMEAPTGTRLSDTETRAMTIERIVRGIPEIGSVSVEIGPDKDRSIQERGENIAQFTVRLKDANQAPEIQDRIIETLRHDITRATTEKITFTLPSIFSFKTAIEAQVFGDDLADLKRIGENVLENVRGVSGVRDAELSVKSGYPEIIITLDKDLLASKGITPGQVAARVRREVQGEVATRFNRSGQKLDIRVRSDLEQLNSVQDLRHISVTDSPPPIPLESVAHIEVREGPSEIRRIDQRHVVVVSANVQGRDLGAVSTDIQNAMDRLERPEGVFFQLGGQHRELEVSFNSLVLASFLAIFLVYVVMACQFESLVHPALIMLTVPLGGISVIYVLYLAHIEISIMVFLGGIVLAGIIVDNAIVLVDYVNQLRERGLSKLEALVLGGKVRLRPILMTTMTTCLGLLPMILGAGEGAELRRPMAITLMSGLAFGTLLTLLIIPMAYYLFGGKDPENEQEP